MENIKEIINQLNGEVHILIERGNGEFTSMPKSVWDKLQAQKELGGTL